MGTQVDTGGEYEINKFRNQQRDKASSRSNGSEQHTGAVLRHPVTSGAAADPSQNFILSTKMPLFLEGQQAAVVDDVDFYIH